MQTITLPDGFKGHTREFDVLPLEHDETTVKLSVAGSSTFLFSYFYRDSFEWDKETIVCLK